MRRIRSWIKEPRLFLSYRRAARHNTVLRHNHNTVSNVVSGSVEILNALFVEDPDVFSDVRVLIDNGFPDDRPFADSDVWNSLLTVIVEVFFILVEVRAHHHHA